MPVGNAFTNRLGLESKIQAPSWPGPSLAPRSLVPRSPSARSSLARRWLAPLRDETKTIKSVCLCFSLRSYDKGHLFHKRAHAALSVYMYTCACVCTHPLVNMDACAQVRLRAFSILRMHSATYIHMSMRASAHESESSSGH